MWYIYQSGSWQPIPGDDLENGFKEGKERIPFNGTHVANIGTMTACSANKPYELFPIKRCDTSGAASSASAPLPPPPAKTRRADADNEKDSPRPPQKVPKVSDSQKPSAEQVQTDSVKAMKKGKGVIDTGFVQKNKDVKQCTSTHTYTHIFL